MEHIYDIHTLIKTDFAFLPDIIIERLLTRLGLGHVTIIALFVVDVWQASLVIKVGIIKMC